MNGSPGRCSSPGGPRLGGAERRSRHGKQLHSLPHSKSDDEPSRACGFRGQTQDDMEESQTLEVLRRHHAHRSILVKNACDLDGAHRHLCGDFRMIEVGALHVVLFFPGNSQN